jgi:hypothetical protein
VLYVAIVRQVHEGHTMRVITPSTIAALITLLMTAHAAAQTAPQIIIVDGVKYQALPTTTVNAPVHNPYAFPTAVATPIAVTPVAYPVHTSQPVSVSVPSNYEAQTVHPVANVVVPVIATAIGVWALSQFFRPERGYSYGRSHGNGHATGHGHAHGNRPVSVQRPVVPVWVPPAHGGHHPR